jgi:predicted signal transduction protein with EAL and GGDEF domain
MLVRLRELGVKVAIDDFGTGYSSLSVLGGLPVDTLKIDRSFVIGIGRNKGSDDLVRHILQLASDFHLHTVAEGVERLDQVGALKQLGCQSIQGFYFSKPLSSADVEALLQLDSELVVGIAPKALVDAPVSPSPLVPALFTRSDDWQKEQGNAALVWSSGSRTEPRLSTPHKRP